MTVIAFRIVLKQAHMSARILINGRERAVHPSISSFLIRHWEA